MVSKIILEGRGIVEKHRAEHQTFYPHEGTTEELTQKHLDLSAKTLPKLLKLGFESIDDLYVQSWEAEEAEGIPEEERWR